MAPIIWVRVLENTLIWPKTQNWTKLINLCLFVSQIITANPWNTIALLCGAFLALFKAAEFAKLSVKWMIKIRKRHLKKRGQAMNHISWSHPVLFIGLPTLMEVLFTSTLINLSSYQSSAHLKKWALLGGTACQTAASNLAQKEAVESLMEQIQWIS